jgi:hypothetical protein
MIDGKQIGSAHEIIGSLDGHRWDCEDFYDIVECAPFNARTIGLEHIA